MKIFIFGNGNISFNDFVIHYKNSLEPLLMDKSIRFLLCDFRGTDTLVMEFLKKDAEKVTIYHIGEKPRYYPDGYKTKVNKWTVRGGFISDEERDSAAINDCTHFLAKDFNSNNIKTSGTRKNIEKCLREGKINLLPI